MSGGAGKNDTLESLFAEARARFSQAHLPDAAFDARMLISGLLDLPASAFMTRGSESVSPGDAVRIRSGIARRAAHEPVHRILGWREFYGLTLGMSKDTLEPRPDTEALVETVLPLVRACVAGTGTCRILDLGTGTGAICLALLSAVPEATGTGTDLSAAALDVASANATRNKLESRFSILTSDWFLAVEGEFDLVVSNPPYIRSAVVASLAPEVRDHDPALALDGGSDGLDGYRAIASGAPAHLAPGGVVAVEIGYDQRRPVAALFEAAGFKIVTSSLDLAGHDRVLVFKPDEFMAETRHVMETSFGIEKKTLGNPDEAS